MRHLWILGAGTAILGLLMAAIVIEIGAEGYPISTKIAAGMIFGGLIIMCVEGLAKKLHDWWNRKPP